jgi:hypothetical protein
MTEETISKAETGHLHEDFTYIGSGSPGGKASGLALLQKIISKHFPEKEISGMRIDVPQTTVLLSNVFDNFMQNNSLYELALSENSDEDVAINFINASFGGLYAGDLYQLIETSNRPLAVRSSSICEDSINEPFAGVYETKMIANNQPDKAQRFKALIDAVKFVYASLFFQQSKAYFRSIGRDLREEKMAIVIQEVVGDHYADKTYHPLLSGVLKSYNFYPSENIKPEDGFAALAFGLGKTIVNGESCWSYCPSYPRTPQPFNNIKDMLDSTQKHYWAINLEQLLNYNPIAETEYLLRRSIFDAEEGSLFHLTSTYDHQSDTIRTGYRRGGTPVLDFAPILKAETLPLNKIIRSVLDACETETGEKVEIEFAVALDKAAGKPAFRLLQLRAVNVCNQIIDLPKLEENKDDLLLFSENALGNGIYENINDIIYVRPENFQAENSAQIADEISELNQLMVENKRKYLLIGFGRWGTSDPWCGIPVNWSQISHAGVIVETSLPSINADFSQGAHFFHNMTSHLVLYFSVNEQAAKYLDWKWLQEQKSINETRYLKHVRTDKNLRVIVDGRSSKGVILK